MGLVDPLTAAERPASERVNDGLPETLEEVVSYYRGRYYKLKVGGDVKADLDRLTRIASVLDAGAGDYKVTFDGNEQYDDVDGIVELWRKVEETPALAQAWSRRRCSSSSRSSAQAALSRPVTALAEYRPVIIDESDGELSTFPEALTLGYAGVSSKNCKGFYKSILNAARVAKLRRRARYFMSAEDLTTQPGVSVQQDLALVSLLGLTHVERNAHHFIDGMSSASRGRAECLRRRASRPLRKAAGQAGAAEGQGRHAGAGVARTVRASPSVSISTSSRCAPCRAAPNANDLKACNMSKLPGPLRQRSRPLEDFMTTPSAALIADLASDAGRHHDPGRRRQDGADAGAPGQARRAEQARDRRRALQRDRACARSWRRPGVETDRRRPARPRGAREAAEGGQRRVHGRPQVRRRRATCRSPGR